MMNNKPSESTKSIVCCPLCGTTLEPGGGISIDRNRLLAMTKERYGIDIDYLVVRDPAYLTCDNCGLGSFHPLTAGDAKYYNALGGNRWYYHHEDKSEYIYAGRIIGSDAKVLDIGCGDGVLRSFVSCASYTGLELGWEAVLRAQQSGLDVQQKTVETFAAECGEAQFDVICAFQVLEHLSSVKSFIIATKKLLKPSGVFLVAVPNNDSLLRFADNNILNMVPHHLLHWNVQSLNYLASQFGFNVVDVFVEPVTKIHHKWFSMTKIAAHFKKLLNNSYRPIDERTMTRNINRVAIRVASIAEWFGFDIIKAEAGHTIIYALQAINANESETESAKSP